MPVCHAEFKQDATVYVTFIFLKFSFLFPEAMPSLTSLLPTSALQGWAPFFWWQQQAVGAVLFSLLPALCFCRPPGRGVEHEKALPFLKLVATLQGAEFSRTSLAEAAAHARWLGSASSASQPL